jgi:hypothetical protein
VKREGGCPPHTVAAGGSQYLGEEHCAVRYNGWCPDVNMPGSQTVNVCPLPTSESTQLQGILPGYPIVTEFNQTLSDSGGHSFDSHEVEEMPGGQGTNTCPSGLPNACTGSTTFQIGVGYQPAVMEGNAKVDVGPLLVGTPNEFFDQYSVTSNQSLLDQFGGGNNCRQTCSQQYFNTCTPQGQILDHTFTYTFTKSTISGTKVTLVTVSE